MRACADCLVQVVAVALCLVGTAAAGPLEPAAIIAGRYVAPDGTLQRDVAIVISHGKISSVVPRSEYDGTSNVVEFLDAVVSPGLIDVRSALGAHNKNIETTRSIDPGASAVDILDSGHRDFQAALRSGITAAMIVPADNNLVSGVAVTVKTGVASGPLSAPPRPRILRSDGPLMLALGPSVWERDRAPTSRIGSLAMLREVLDEARAGRAHVRLNAFASKEMDAVVVCAEAMDVSAALRTLAGSGRRITVVHTGDTHELAGELLAGGYAVVVGPYRFETDPRTLASAGAWASAGVEVVFAGRLPEYPADSLRVTGALAVRYGMEPAKARQAMTASAAGVAGVADRVGAIRSGFDADLVVFSDDPLRLDARVLEVYVSGVRMHKADD